MTDSSNATPEKFEFWALVEVFGHQRFAGLISESNIGGCAFIRVDVPKIDPGDAHEKVAAFTKYFGQGAIYSISPVSEEIARALAGSLQQKPVQAYELPERQLTAPAGDLENMPL